MAAREPGEMSGLIFFPPLTSVLGVSHRPVDGHGHAVSTVSQPRFRSYFGDHMVSRVTSFRRRENGEFLWFGMEMDEGFRTALTSPKPAPMEVSWKVVA